MRVEASARAVESPGVITYYALQFPTARLGIMFRLGLVFFGWLRISAWTGLVLWIALQMLGAAMQVGGFTNVSAFAHPGGAGAGVAVWFLRRKLAAGAG
ncbi:MAG TPA: hypothetical protein VFY29_13180 [Terriglobia bacterium]|nr:hypothetical protein [Terriglobia bacterium]